MDGPQLVLLNIFNQLFISQEMIALQGRLARCKLILTTLSVHNGDKMKNLQDLEIGVWYEADGLTGNSSCTTTFKLGLLINDYAEDKGKTIEELDEFDLVCFGNDMVRHIEANLARHPLHQCNHAKITVNDIFRTREEAIIANVYRIFRIDNTRSEELSNKAPSNE